MTDNRKQNSPTPADPSHKQAMHTAVRILTHRDHSKYELKQKLQQRGFMGKIIDRVLWECERLNYIDDNRTAQVYISQLKRKCFGKRYIRMALKRKRLSGKTIEDILLENYAESDERENAGKLLAKKMQTFNREEDAKKRRNNIYRFLYSRGFRKDVIAELIRDSAK